MHLRSSHYQFEMKEVLDHIDSLLKLERRQKDVDELLRAVAYYTAAVCEQERDSTCRLSALQSIVER